MTKRTYQQLISTILISLILFVFLSSCGTTNKVKTSTHITKDSVTNIKRDTSATTSKDSIHVIKDNTVTTKVTDGSYTKEIVIEFDTTAVPNKNDSLILDGIYNRGGITASDYFPLRPIKKITIKESGKESIKEQTNTDKTDSTKTAATTSIQAHSEQNTHVATENTIKNKEVHRASYAWLWWLLLIPAIYVVYKNWDKIKKLV